MTERVQLLSLPAEIQQMVADRRLAFKKAVLLARLPSEEQQAEFALDSVANRLEPTELRRRVSAELGTTRDTDRGASKSITVPKLTAKTEGYVLWFKGLESSLDLQSASPKARQAAIKAIDDLWVEIKKTRTRLDSPVPSSRSIKPIRDGSNKGRWSRS